MYRVNARAVISRAAIAAGCAAAIAVAAVSPAFATGALGAVSVGAAGAVSPSPTPSSGRTPASLSTVQAKGFAAIDARLASLSTALSRIAAATGANPADQATLTARLTSTRSGLTALRATIAADTTVADAVRDVRSIYTRYRVYAVALPQARIALAADRLNSTTLPRLQKLHDRLAQRKADATRLAQMQTDIDTASAAVQGLPAAALAVTPAAYNADRTAMDGVRSRLTSARASAKAAAQIAKSLRGSVPAPSGSGAASGS